MRLELGDRRRRQQPAAASDDTFDPGGGGGIGYPEGVGAPPGETAKVRLSVTDGPTAQPVAGDRLRIGVGLYAQGLPARSGRSAAGDVP